MCSTSSYTTPLIPNKLQDYTVLELLGQGCFGAVAKCVKPQTLEVVAVKIMKDANDDAEKEAQILQDLSQIQPDQVNIVKFREYFTCQDFQCMAFEMLDRSLLDLMKQRQCPLSLCELCPVTQQLLVAFDALKKVGIIHADLKPDNIMLVNQNHQPLKVKLIDFGCAFYTSEVEFETVIQPLEYRAPEVSLGLPLSEALDMWSLGCTLGECYLGHRLFSGGSPYNNLMSIVNLLGPPTNALLNKSTYCSRYFAQTDGFGQWRFKSLEEYWSATGNRPFITHAPLKGCTNLDSAVEEYCPVDDATEYRDQMVFIDLLKRLLNPDPEKRITASDALKHPFITMEHLVSDNSEYTEWARDVMALGLRGSTPAPCTAEVNAVSCPNTKDQDVSQVTAAPERPGSSLAYGDCSLRAEDTKHCVEIDEEVDSSIQLPECIVTEDEKNLPMDVYIPPFVELDNRIDVDFTDDPDDACYIELDEKIQTDTITDLSASKEEETTCNPGYVIIDMEDCTGASESDSSGSRACNNFWQSCKKFASSSAVAVQNLVSYALDVALPMLGWVYDLTTTMHSPDHNQNNVAETPDSKTTLAISRRPLSSTSRGR